MPKEHDVYLGDGLYGDHDGIQFWLTAPTSGGDQRVALEPYVLDNFLRYAGVKLGGRFTFTKNEDVEACRVINPPGG